MDIEEETAEEYREPVVQKMMGEEFNKYFVVEQEDQRQAKLAAKSFKDIWR